MEKKRSSNAFPSRSSPHRNARNVLEPIGRTLAKIAAREEDYSMAGISATEEEGRMNLDAKGPKKLSVRFAKDVPDGDESLLTLSNDLTSAVPKSEKGLAYLRQNGPPNMENLGAKCIPNNPDVFRYLEQHARWLEANDEIGDHDNEFWISTQFMTYYYKQNNVAKCKILHQQRLAFARVLSKAFRELCPPLDYVAQWLVYPEEHMRAAFIIDAIAFVADGDNISKRNIGLFYEKYVVEECVPTPKAQNTTHEMNMSQLEDLGASHLMDVEKFPGDDLVHAIISMFSPEKGEGDDVSMGDTELDETTGEGETEGEGEGDAVDEGDRRGGYEPRTSPPPFKESGLEEDEDEDEEDEESEVLRKKRKLAEFELQEIQDNDDSLDRDYEDVEDSEHTGSDGMEGIVPERVISSLKAKNLSIAEDGFYDEKGNIDDKEFVEMLHQIIDTCFVEGKRSAHFEVAPRLKHELETKCTLAEDELYQRGGETCMAVLNVLEQMFGRDLDFITDRCGLTEKWNRHLQSWNLFGRYRTYAMEEEKQKDFNGARLPAGSKEEQYKVLFKSKERPEQLELERYWRDEIERISKAYPALLRGAKSDSNAIKKDLQKHHKLLASRFRDHVTVTMAFYLGDDSRGDGASRQILSGSNGFPGVLRDNGWLWGAYDKLHMTLAARRHDLLVGVAPPENVSSTEEDGALVWSITVMDCNGILVASGGNFKKAVFEIVLRMTKTCTPRNTRPWDVNFIKAFAESSLCIYYPEAVEGEVPVVGLWAFKSGIVSNLSAELRAFGAPRIYEALFKAFPNIVVRKMTKEQKLSKKTGAYDQVPVAFVGKTAVAFVGQGYSRPVTFAAPYQPKETGESSTTSGNGQALATLVEVPPPPAFATTQESLNEDSDDDVLPSPPPKSSRSLKSNPPPTSTLAPKSAPPAKPKQVFMKRPVVPAPEMHLDSHPLVEEAVVEGIIPSRMELEKGSIESANVGMSKGLMVANNTSNIRYDAKTGTGKFLKFSQAPLAPRSTSKTVGKPLAPAPFAASGQPNTSAKRPPVPPALGPKSNPSVKPPALDRLLLEGEQAGSNLGKKTRAELQNGTSSRFNTFTLMRGSNLKESTFQAPIPSPTPGSATTSKADAQLVSSPAPDNNSFAWNVPVNGPTFKEVNGGKKKSQSYGPLGVKGISGRRHMESVEIPPFNRSAWKGRQRNELGDFDNTAFEGERRSGTLTAPPPEPDFGSSMLRSKARKASAMEFEEDNGSKRPRTRSRGGMAE